MSRAASPFSPRVVLALLAVGAGAFLLFLYAIGAGWTGREDRDGGAHAAANGLNGFAGLVRLLEAQGHEVSLSRSEARLDEEALLVLTPPVFADGEAVAEIVEARRYYGPTLLILPKWWAGRADGLDGLDVPQGWVVLDDAVAPEWLGELDGLDDAEAAIAERKRWQGMGLAGALPAPSTALALEADSVATREWASVLALVTDDHGDILVGYLNDNGDYPILDEAAGYSPTDEADEDLWPVVVVAEPDLMNNYGMADRTRAELAHAIVDAALEDYDLPVVFDLTLPGLGRSENLMTLAFAPPFLAATLCLMLAGLVIAWRALRRFGPPVAEAPALAMGKRQLARNGAGLVERARRWRLLGAPYAALVGGRIAEALAIREADPAAREAAIARALAARGIAADYPARAEALRRARRPTELLRAAGALRTIERILTP
ncbi:MAG TPA: DUF4350 domain-containing protein [Croceibacterium sp.]|nr:DUF4350 domain-containing protein [Croceibacterium sp.]